MNEKAFLKALKRVGKKNSYSVKKIRASHFSFVIDGNDKKIYGTLNEDGVSFADVDTSAVQGMFIKGDVPNSEFVIFYHKECQVDAQVQKVARNDKIGLYPIGKETLEGDLATFYKEILREVL